ncbi:TetR/AcrR family transcriptional regulator [Kordiimonas sediminis]|uniref:TetR/AcrR family transcriptional regulator n=1 Tax=Kordiimonas sediminis TaxID=1735581 RepID=UPI00174D127F|nr:TetR/AcrR family transcriptional regulator [Kordiimonas sediminis]
MEKNKDKDQKAVSPFDRKVQWGQKRHLILEQAARIFNEKGARATTFTEIAQSLNLTKTSLYYYVKTKEDLIYQCYGMTLDVMTEMLDEAESLPDAHSQVIRFVELYLHNWQLVFEGKRAPLAILTEIQTLSEGHRSELGRRYINIVDRIAGIIREGRNDGCIRELSGRATARALMGMLGWSAVWFGLLKPQEIGLAVTQVVDVVRQGLAFGGPRGAVVKGLELGQVADAETASFDREEVSQRKRDAFLKIGSTFFNDKGFKATSLDEIAEALNATKGAFYYHIRNKDELLLQCFDRTIRLFEEMQDRANETGKTGRDKLERAARYLFFTQNSERGPLVNFRLLGSLPIEVRRKVIDDIRVVTERFGDFIKEGQKDGSIKTINPEYAQQLITGAVNSASEMTDWLGLMELKRASAVYFDLILGGIAASGSYDDSEEMVLLPNL